MHLCTEWAEISSAMLQYVVEIFFQKSTEGPNLEWEVQKATDIQLCSADTVSCPQNFCANFPKEMQFKYTHIYRAHS